MFSKIKLYLVVGILSILGLGVLLSTFIPKNNSVPSSVANTQKQIYNATGNLNQIVQELKKPSFTDFNYSKNLEDYIIAKTSQVSYYKMPVEITQNIKLLENILYNPEEEITEPEAKIGNLVLKKQQSKDFEEVEDATYFALQDTIYKITDSYVDKDGFVQDYKTFFLENEANKLALEYRFGQELLKAQTIENSAYLTLKTKSNGLVILKINAGKESLILQTEPNFLEIIKDLDTQEVTTSNGVLSEGEPLLNVYYNGNSLFVHSSFHQDRYFVVKENTFTEILKNPKQSQMICKKENCLAILADKIIKLNDGSTFIARNTPKIPKTLEIPIYSWIRWNEQLEIFENNTWQKI